MPRHRASARIALVCAAALAAAVGGCSRNVLDSNEGSIFTKKVDIFTKPDWARAGSDSKTAELGPNTPVGPADLVSADGRCSAPGAPAPAAAANEAPPDRPVGSVAGDLAGSPMPAGLVPSQPARDPGGPEIIGGIGLGMTECDTVRRAGAPSQVSVGTGDGGERKVVLTYLTAPWPGIYTFASGRLKVVERAPAPLTPAKAPPKKKAAAKPKTAATQPFR